MISLLDVNVLIALFDPLHCHHDLAHAWFSRHRPSGWATCPLTENGVIRVLSHPSYPGRGTTVADSIDRLEQFLASGDHHFWPDDVSLRDPSLFTARSLGGHGDLTDAYLLGLAVYRGGRLATLDRGIRLRAVVGAEPHHLELITPRES